MTNSVAALLDLLNVTRSEGQAAYDHVFEGKAFETTRPRVFGGMVLGQALMAAGRTVGPERRPHSLHAYFLRSGDSGEAITYSVSVLRDGRAFSTRSVVANQGDRTLFEMTVSFTVAADGIEHQSSVPDNLDPTVVSPMDSYLDELPRIYREWGSLEVRGVGDYEEAKAGAPARVWMRTVEVLPDDDLLHACVLACISDLSLLTVALLPHNISPMHQNHQVATIDHSIWFHQNTRLDAWTLFEQTSPRAVGGLAFVLADVHDASGVLVASVAQQGLVRAK